MDFYKVPIGFGLALSALWNFTLDRRYTFKFGANVPVATTKVFGFYLVFTPLSTYLGHLAETVGVNDFIILVATMLVNFVLEFLFCKFVVYRGKGYIGKGKTARRSKRTGELYWQSCWGAPAISSLFLHTHKNCGKLIIPNQL